MVPESKVNGANMGPTWVLSAPDGPHIGPMNLAVRDFSICHSYSSVLICSMQLPNISEVIMTYSVKFNRQQTTTKHDKARTVCTYIEKYKYI